MTRSVTVSGDHLRGLRQLTTDVIDGDWDRMATLVAECAAVFGCDPEEPIDPRLDEDEIVQLVQRRFAADLRRAQGAVQENAIDRSERTVG